MVLKVAIDYSVPLEKSIEANRKEYEVYTNADDKAFLCPVLWISDCGKYLIMRNANVLPKPSTRISEKEFKGNLKKSGYPYEDIESPFNWVGDYLVDYGWTKE